MIANAGEFTGQRVGPTIDVACPMDENMIRDPDLAHCKEMGPHGSAVSDVTGHRLRLLLQVDMAPKSTSTAQTSAAGASIMISVWTE
jgi:hypothetical protein